MSAAPKGALSSSACSLAVPSMRRPNWEYNHTVKLKTSITLSEDILKTIDRSTKKGGSRSETIERVLREGLAARARRAADARDLALINEHAEALNEEAEDVLRYQPGL